MKRCINPLFSTFPRTYSVLICLNRSNDSKCWSYDQSDNCTHKTLGARTRKPISKILLFIRITCVALSHELTLHFRAIVSIVTDAIDASPGRTFAIGETRPPQHITFISIYRWNDCIYDCTNVVQVRKHVILQYMSSMIYQIQWDFYIKQ